MIQINNVTKTFGSTTAVDNVTFSLAQGEFFALLGPNGAGKTTLVRMLLGFAQPSSGDITINGRNVRNVSARVGVGYLPEHFNMPAHLSGFQYLKRQAALLGIKGAEAEKQIHSSLERVAMLEAHKKKSGTYSKGMKQRIGLAATLLGDPKFLLLDEPITGLDPIGVRQVRNTLEHLNRQGVTILLNSHLLSEVEKTCTSAGILYKGRLLVKGDLKQILPAGQTLEDVFVKHIEGNHA